MSNRVYKSDLSTKGLDFLIKQLESYANVDLPNIADAIVRRLADVGIEVAQSAVYSDWRPLIQFTFKPISLGDGEIIGQDVQLIHRIWYPSKEANAKDMREAYVSPLLMSEYGAGSYAAAGHRGTFPGQRHAFKSEWFWYDGNGKKHSSEEDYHMISTQPMYKALLEMMTKAEAIIREVFSLYGY